MRYSLLTLLALSSLLSAAPLPAGTAAPPGASKRQPLVTGLPNNVSWSDSFQDSTKITLHYRAKVRPLKLFVGRDHPNGVRVMVLFNGPYAVNLLDATSKLGDFTDGGSAFDQFGDLSPGCSMQVAEWNYRRGRSPFLVMAVGNGTNRLSLSVLAYYPPQHKKDALDPKNWREIGAFAGNGAAYFYGTSVTLPNGTAGFGTEYVWKNGKFESIHLIPRDRLIH